MGNIGYTCLIQTDRDSSLDTSLYISIHLYTSIYILDLNTKRGIGSYLSIYLHLEFVEFLFPEISHGRQADGYRWSEVKSG